jgi:superfamily II DNA or RNA helicase
VEDASGETIHDDEFCVARRQGRSAFVSPKRPFATWRLASVAEKLALLAAIETCTRLLREAHPRATIDVRWAEAPSTDVPAPSLQIALRAIPSTTTRLPHPHALIRGESDPLLHHLAACFPHAARVDIAVAFVLDKGVSLIRPYLHDHLRRDRPLRLLTGDYFDVTEPNGLASLLDLQGGPDLRIFESAGTSFHPKAYIFHLDDGEGIAFVGSSNLSRVALGNGVEWNYRVLRSRDDDGFDSVCDGFEQLFGHHRTRVLDHDWIERYRLRRRPDLAERQGVRPEAEQPPEPHGIQKEALAALEATRADGNIAGLVVLATGLGKTFLSAFDSLRFKRVLFVAHREEILDQALATFRRIRPAASLGRYIGTEKTPDADVLFASIQTLGRSRHLQAFAADAFDYIVIDEFHHAAARTYRLLLEHFRPQFLLGLTATPERTDGADLLSLCGHNLVFRCGLEQGVRAGRLCPFTYHGVPDDVDYAQIPWRSRRFDEAELTRQLATQRRADNALEQHRKHGGTRTLALCASQAHADFMADHFSQNGVPSVAVHSGETSAPRANSLDGLREGRTRVVFSVDMFNEGIDVPEVDTVMMLRPTESRVLWLQQLGRGLRKTDDPTKRLQVIDYIGNHRCFLEKARALLSLLGEIAESHHALRAALARLRDGGIDLPDGCEVTYELEAIDILDRLLEPTRAEDRLRIAYEEFRERNERRPTAAELARSGQLSRAALKQSAGSWFAFVDALEDLTNEQRQALDAHRELLQELEHSKMERSYKMLALQAMLELDAFPGACKVDALVERFARIADRSPTLRKELATTLAGGTKLAAMVRQNPLRAWAGTKSGKGSRYFELSESTFRTLFDADATLRPHLQELVREIVEWRLAEYLACCESPSFACRVTHHDGQLLLDLPDREKHLGLPEGDVAIIADGERLTARFTKTAVDLVTGPHEPSTNVLPALLRSWFGDDAGADTTRNQVRFSASEDAYEVSPVAEESPLQTMHDMEGRQIDAHFVLRWIGRRAEVLWQSRGGKKGSESARNVDYSKGLDLLISRARDLNFVLADALIDSNEMTAQPLARRRLALQEPLPLELAKIADPTAVRRWIAKAQREHGKNETRRIRLVFERADAVHRSELAARLAGTTRS